MRGLDNILDQLKISLQNNNSPLTDFTPQGVNYTLLRAIAAGIQQVETNNYDNLLNFADFTKATGAGLEQFAALFGLTRKQSALASGWVLISTDSVISVLNGLIFTDTQTGNQYFTSNATDITVSPYVETPVPISCTTPGNGKALKAGAKVFSQNPAILNATIGFERKFDGTACGDMVDGGNLESDNSLRSRMYALFRAGGLVNKESLKALLIEHPAVLDAILLTRTAGVVEVFIKSNQSEQDVLIQEIGSLIESYLVGVIVKVVIKNATPIRVELNIKTDSSADLNELKDSIRGVIENYINTVRTRLYFDPDELKELIKPFVQLVEVLAPSEPLEWDDETFLELGDLNVNLKI
jgi:hypothetical protein